MHVGQLLQKILRQFLLKSTQFWTTSISMKQNDNLWNGNKDQAKSILEQVICHLIKEIVENVLHGRNYLIMVAGVAIGCMTPWPPLHSEI